ncbi:MAG: hypothetical protein ABIH41_06325 [Nanoarchaeota archaeon]
MAPRFLEKLFGSAKNRFLRIEINDSAIDNDIAHLLIDAEKRIRELQEALAGNDIQTKDQKTEEVLGIFEKMRVDVDQLVKDVGIIRMEELQEKTYVTFHDDQYLLDKIHQLSVIRGAIVDIIEMMHEEPSDQEYEGGVLDELFESINRIIDSLNTMKHDDQRLRDIYAEITQ